MELAPDAPVWLLGVEHKPTASADEVEDNASPQVQVRARDCKAGFRDCSRRIRQSIRHSRFA